MAPGAPEWRGGAVGAGLWLDDQKPTACQPGEAQGPQSSFFSRLKSSANLRSCSLAACDSSCNRWLFCRRLATSDCSTTLSCLSWGQKGWVSHAKVLTAVHTTGTDPSYGAREAQLQGVKSRLGFSRWAALGGLLHVLASTLPGGLESL